MNQDYRSDEYRHTAPPEATDTVAETSGIRAADPARTFINRVYNWMTFGLALTGLIAWGISSDPRMVNTLMTTPLLFVGLMIAELILVGVLSAAIHKMSPAVATLCYLGYAAMNGVLFSSILYFYDPAAIYMAFFTCAGTFAVTSIFGYMTRMNLASMGGFLTMALIGLIIASVVNLFWANSTLYWLITYAGVLIFVGLTAYDTQKLRMISEGMDEESVYSADAKKYSILGALTLYLDFINLFLMLLRIFGGRRN